MQIPTLKEIVKNNKAIFSHYQNGKMYYTVNVEDQAYLFPIDLADGGIGEGKLQAEEKAILLMRFIRIALKEQEFVAV